MRKLTKVFNSDTGRGFTIYKDTEWGEYRVQFYADHKHLLDADYHTDDKQDAYDTANGWMPEAAYLDLR